MVGVSVLDSSLAALAAAGKEGDRGGGVALAANQTVTTAGVVGGVPSKA